MRLVGSLLLIAGVALGVAAQFAPNADADAGFADVKAYPWGHEASALGDSDSETWFDADSDEDGHAQLVAGAVLSWVGLLAGVLAFFLALVSRGGNLSGFLATSAAVSSLVMFAIGIDAFYGGDLDLATGFFLHIGSAAAYLVGSIVSSL